MNKKYIINSVVSCRVEGKDGAILFHPDTDKLKAVNLVGLLIWQVLSQPSTVDEITEHLLNTCESVPAGQVKGDVENFIETLLPDEFILEA